MILYVCTACSADGGLLDAARAAFPDLDVKGVDCMSGCTRAQTVAFRAPGKVAYLFGDITEHDLPNLRTFAEHYASSPDGTFDDARVLGDLRTKALARIPG